MNKSINETLLTLGKMPEEGSGHPKIPLSPVNSFMGLPSHVHTRGTPFVQGSVCRKSMASLTSKTTSRPELKHLWRHNTPCGPLSSKGSVLSIKPFPSSHCIQNQKYSVDHLKWFNMKDKDQRSVQSFCKQLGKQVYVLRNLRHVETLKSLTSLSASLKVDTEGSTFTMLHWYR